MKILITAGGTTEKIDNVRKISNSSSGALGKKIAETFLSWHNIEKLYYVCENQAMKPIHNKVEFVITQGVTDLHDKVKHILETEEIDIVIHSMAISDYRTKRVNTMTNIKEQVSDKLWNINESIKSLNREDFNRHLSEIFDSVVGIDSAQKVGSNHEDLIIELEKTPKVIQMIKETSPKSILVGFKLLSNVSEDNLVDVAHELLMKNNCDYVLANDLTLIDSSTHIGHLVKRDKTYDTFTNKDDIARGIVKQTLSDTRVSDEK